ncbi:MAG: histidine triad nucleotide-binding protein [Elusimicrobiota bacterium]
MAGDCLFCKIVSGEIPSRKVYEDERALAFKDLNPAAPTHLLVVPKKHIAKLSDSAEADESLLGHLQLVIRKLAAENGLEDFRVVLNNGRGAGQSVDHVHYHVLSGRRMTWPPG